MNVLTDQFESITSIESLIKAHQAALRGKRNNFYATNFDHSLISRMNGLQKELRSQTYKPMQYHKKIIFEPKTRQIQAPTYRDRIVHHSVYSHLSPFYEKIFIPDSYACRINKGIHRATKRIRYFLRQENMPLYVCQLDISKFYPSVNHNKLISLLEYRIDDRRLLDLLKLIIGSANSGHNYDSLFEPDSNFHTKGRHGLPIGNLTSQLFANIYLHEVDNYAKQKLKIRQYVRYMDDIVFLCNDKRQLLAWRDAISQFAYNHLYLTINPRKVRIYPANQGVSFIGYKIFPNYLLLRGSSVRRFKKHYRHQLKDVANCKISREELDISFNSWKAHAAHASTERLVSQLESWQKDYLRPRRYTQLSLFNLDDKTFF